MSKEEVQRIDDQGMAAWDKHDPDAFVSLFADSFVWYDWTVPESMREKKAARAYFSGWVTAIPDMRVRQVSRVVAQDAVAAEIEFSGTTADLWRWRAIRSLRPTRWSWAAAHT
jgi:hypothetical protein